MNRPNIQEQNQGKVSREHVITWVTMVTAIGAVAAQVGAKLFLNIDLGINIDMALATGFGSGAAYTMARMVTKTGIAFAEGKVKAAKASAEPAVAPLGSAGITGPTGSPGNAGNAGFGSTSSSTVSPFTPTPSPATLLPPKRTSSVPTETKVW